MRYRELLPADTVLYSVVYANEPKGACKDKPASDVMERLKGVVDGFIQIGGDETVGNGVCKIKWVSINGGRSNE